MENWSDYPTRKTRSWQQRSCPYQKERRMRNHWYPVKTSWIDRMILVNKKTKPDDAVIYDPFIL